MNYTTYLFDFDYTLADSSRGIITCFRNVLIRHGYTEVTDDEIKHTIGKTLEESFSILTGVTDTRQLADFKAEYRKEADIHMTVNTVLFLETKSVLTALKDGGAQLGIISTKYRFRIKELLDRHFPEGFIDIIVGGEDVKEAKPSPEGLLLAIRQLHTTKAETLYIGDSTIDAEAAQAAGIDFAGVTHGVTTAKELSKYPHLKIMSSLEELLEDKEELPTPLWEMKKHVCPKNKSCFSHQQKKRINIGQGLLLSLLLFLSIKKQAADGGALFLFIFLLTLWGVLRKRRILPLRAKNFLSSRFHPHAVRLRAIHIRLIRGKTPPPLHNGASVCQNCGTTYTGNYCNRCGQSRNTPRYSMGNAMKHIAGGFLNIDNGFGRALIDLLHRPGYMIRDFIGGKRVLYFRPFQTLFVLAAIYIMTVQLVDPDALNGEGSSLQEEKSCSAIDIKSQEENAGQEKSTEYRMPIRPDSEQQDEKIDFIDFLFQKSDTAETRITQFVRQSPFLMKIWNLLKRWTNGNKAFQIIATLPLFAVATQLAFRRKKYRLNYNTTEHLFIQTYIACQILLLSIIALPFYGYAQMDDLYDLPLWGIFALYCWDYKQLYQCSWWRSFWCTALMSLYSFLLLILFAALIVSVAIAIFS